MKCYCKLTTDGFIFHVIFRFVWSRTYFVGDRWVEGEAGMSDRYTEIPPWDRGATETDWGHTGEAWGPRTGEPYPTDNTSTERQGDRDNEGCCLVGTSSVY